MIDSFFFLSFFSLNCLFVVCAVIVHRSKAKMGAKYSVMKRMTPVELIAEFGRLFFLIHCSVFLCVCDGGWFLIICV